MKDYNISTLITKLRDAGVLTAKTLNGGKQTVHYWIRTGKITPRQLPYSGYYKFNDNEIKAIIKEFSVGGKGYWNYQE